MTATMYDITSSIASVQTDREKVTGDQTTAELMHHSTTREHSLKTFTQTLIYWHQFLNKIHYTRVIHNTHNNKKLCKVGLLVKM